MAATTWLTMFVPYFILYIVMIYPRDIALADDNLLSKFLCRVLSRGSQMKSFLQGGWKRLEWEKLVINIKTRLNSHRTNGLLSYLRLKRKKICMYETEICKFSRIYCIRHFYVDRSTEETVLIYICCSVLHRSCKWIHVSFESGCSALCGNRRY